MEAIADWLWPKFIAYSNPEHRQGFFRCNGPDQPVTFHTPTHPAGNVSAFTFAGLVKTPGFVEVGEDVTAGLAFGWGGRP